MIIYGITDIHGSLDALKRFVSEVKGADLILVAGDLTTRGSREEAASIISILRKGCPKIMAVPGNMDTWEVASWLEEEGISLHGRGLVLPGGVGLAGAGGCPDTPFQTPLELGEEGIRSLLLKARGEISEVERFILLSHTPPVKTLCDRVPSCRHIGSREIRGFIERERPILNICGHAHEARGEDRVGETPVMNPGPIKGGYAVRIVASGETLTPSIIRVFSP